jgi:5-dehydro-2-deoxygluconokinase
LLIEVILPGAMPVDAHTVARAISLIYEIGVRPDWWELEPSSNPAAWENIEGAIARGDPYCRGIVLLGLSAPHTALAGSFAAAAPYKVIKGFAIGRTIFEEVARQWFHGVMDDDAAVRGMAERLAALVSTWRHARGEEAA